MAKKASALERAGSWAFIIGVLIAIVVGFGFGSLNDTVTSVLVVIGLIVGLLNVTAHETGSYLLASVSLVIVSSLSANALSALPVAQNILAALNVFVVPATIIVALKAIYSLASN